MVYDASFWKTQRNWTALTGALTGAATRHDYLGMLRHIEAVRAAGMPEERIRQAYGEVALMVPSVPAFETLEQVASGRAPVPAPPAANAPQAASPVIDVSDATVVSAPGTAYGMPPGDGFGAGASASTPAAVTATAATIEPAEPGSGGTVQQLDYWLSVLRDGDDAQKIEARGNLSVIFEERGLFSEAIEMLEGNAWAGVRDAAAQRRLAGLYRQIGRQDLADKAISDLYQFGTSGGVSAPPAVVSSVVLPGVRSGTIASTFPAPADPTPAPEPVAAPPAVAPAWRRPRPVWFTIALMVATFGLYGYYWLFASWRELKRESGNQGMHPFWHMLGVAIIPIYGWYLFDVHIRAIRRLGISAGTGTTLSPGLCVLLFILTAIVNRVTIRVEPWTPTVSWLDPAVLAIDVLLIAWPQAALADAWHHLPGGAAPFRVHSFEWFILIVGGIVWTGILAGAVPL